jgi:capsular exopolysaccharide synthesis family protein
MRLIQKHVTWLVIAAVVGLAGALGIVSLRSAAYTSTASVDVEPRIITGSTPVVPNLVTEERVATSGAVLGQVAPSLGMSSTELATHVATSVPSTSTILVIGCTMPSPAQAQNCATVVTEAYINFRNQASALPSVQAVDPLRVTRVSPANLPTSPAGTGKAVLLAIGALLGLLIGFGAVYLRDRADDRVRDADDLSRNLGAATVVEIASAERAAQSPAFAFARTPASRAAEAYRYLRIRIGALAPARDSGGYVVLVTAPRGGEGSTSVASNLATALAQSGDKVLLVDGNVRDATLSAVYAKAGHRGLVQLLTGTSSLTEVAQATSVPRMKLIPAGQSRDGSAEALEADELARVFASLQAVADVVVVDSSPVLAVSDPIALASVSDVVVVVADVRRTTRTEARAVGHEISPSGNQHVVGVLNNASRMPERPASPAAVPIPLPVPAAAPATVPVPVPTAATVPVPATVPAAAPAEEEDSSGPVAEGVLLPQAASASSDGEASVSDSDE